MSRSNEELDRLEDILSGLPPGNFPMSLSELDGYVTGLLCCPEPIPPSEWLSQVWSETGEAEFPDLPTAETTISAVMAHYNAVALQITTTLGIEPIYEVDPNSDETLWEPWVDGFTGAVPGHGFETVLCAGHAASLNPVAASVSRALCSARI